MRSACLLLASFLVACGGGAPSTDSPTSPSPGASEPAAAAAGDGASPSPGATPEAGADPATPAGSAAPATGAPGVAGDGEELPFTTGGTGKLPAATIKKVVRSKMPGYVDCYQKAVEKAPDLKGKVSMRFRIERSGKVGEVEPRGASVKKHPDFAGCLREQLASLTFPPPKGGPVEVVYPLEFASE